tara:strand:- start:217 stop:399 length:183 start_codon:yes stop_codon:yes gene_type:complete
MDIIHLPRKGPPRRSWKQSDLTEEYRQGWNFIFKKGKEKCVIDVKEGKKSSDRNKSKPCS